MNWYKTIKLSASQADIQALSILDNDNNLLNEIKAISPESKYVPIIAYFYKNNNVNLSVLHDDIKDYKNFIDKKQLPLVDIRKDGAYLNNEKINYLQLQEMIHHQRDYKKYLHEEKKKSELPQDLIPIISKNNITVYESFSREKCVNLGKGQTFCISNPNISQNMYQSYRDTQTSSFYFVFDKNREDSDPLSLVVVDITENDILLTDKTNNTGNIKEFGNDSGKYFEYLESKGISRDIFKHSPKTEEEKREGEELGFRETGLDWFKRLSMDYKKKYIGRGHKLTNEQFKYLFDHRLDELIKLYISLGHKLSEEDMKLFVDNKEYLKTYLRSRLIKQEYTIDLTFHEYNLLNEEQRKTYINSIKKVIENRPEEILYVPVEIKNSNIDICIDSVKRNPWTLSGFSSSFLKAHPELCLESVKRNGNTLEYIPDHVVTKEMCLMAIRNSVYSFKYIPTHIKFEYPEIYLEVIKIASQNNIKLIDILTYVPDDVLKKHPKIAIEAVRLNPQELGYIPEYIKLEYPEICYEAVKRKGDTLYYVPEKLKTNELCSIALENNALALEYVPEKLKTYEMCWKAVEKDGYTLRFVPQKLITKELCSKAIENTGYALGYVPAEFKTLELCLKAVKEDGNALMYTPDGLKTEEICKEAIKQTQKAKVWLPDRLRYNKQFIDFINNLE